jgi:hypothetical protein
MKDVLFISTFNKVLYDATGARMVRTFLRTQKHPLYVCIEGMQSTDLPVNDKLIIQSITDDPYLHAWLDKNKDIIPVEFGGEHECTCGMRAVKLIVKKKVTTRRKHKHNCPNGSFRKRACQWFRKITTLKRAIELGYKRIILTDCDMTYKAEIPDDLLNELFENNALFYHCGIYRIKRGLGIETGLYGLNLEMGGQQILDEMFRRFEGDFRSYVRWDDAWMLTVVVDALKDIPMKDLVEGSTKRSGHVINQGPFEPYLAHHKGVHWRTLDLENMND